MSALHKSRVRPARDTDPDATASAATTGVTGPLHAFPRGAGAPDPLEILRASPSWDGIDLVEDGLPPIDAGTGGLLNGGIDAEIYALAVVGDVITARSRYQEIVEREGRRGPMLQIVVATDYRRDDGTLLLRVRTTMIARQATA